jgi:prevent-host-death family protein
MCYILLVTRIGIRELRQNASRYLEKVKAGEVVEVTERGKLIALLISPSPTASERDRLIARGQLTPAKTSFQLPERHHSGNPPHRASDKLAEQRHERLP